jgi:hypothetical protein
MNNPGESEFCKALVKPTAEKQYLKLDKTAKLRIQSALLELEQAENPLLHHAVRNLTGKLKGDYHLRDDCRRFLSVIFLAGGAIVTFL